MLAFLLLPGTARLWTRAASLQAEGTGTDPRIRAITVTAVAFPIFDVHPGDGISKTVYFNNKIASGVIILNFEISGTPALTLTAGPAWEDEPGPYTSGSTPWSPVVAYSVQSNDVRSPSAGYTATNGAGLEASVAITYVRDVTAPLVYSPSIHETSSQLHGVGCALFYTNTMGGGQPFSLLGYADDALSGVERVQFSPALGNAPDDVTSGFDPWQSPGYTIGPGETASGSITATVRDRVANTAVQTYTYELDGAAPTVTVSAPAMWKGVSPPVPVQWQARDAQSGVARVRLYYRHVPTDTTWQDSGLVQTGDAGTFYFTPDGLFTFAFAARVTDNVGNANTLPPTGTQVVVAPSCTYFPLTLRRYPPQPVGSVVVAGGKTTVYQPSVTLALSATVSGDTVVKMRFSNDGVNWSNWEAFATTKAWTLAGGISGLRTVYAQFLGSKGATSEAATDQVYLSLNGNFEYGSIEPGWQETENPLPVNLVQSVPERPGGSTPPADGSYALLLGNPAYSCTGVPTGTAEVAQAFSLPASAQKLTFRYIIWSQDASVSEYWDRFEVFIGDTLVFFDGNTHNTGLGCDNWWRVPGPYNPRGGQTSGWATAEIDVGAYANQTVTISFRNYSRWDNTYNTYTFVDRVTIEGGW